MGRIRGVRSVHMQCDDTHEYTLTAHRHTGEGAGHIRGREEWAQCDSFMNTLPAQCNICIHNDYMCV